MKNLSLLFFGFFLLTGCGPSSSPASEKSDREELVSNPKVLVSWHGYKDGNVIKLVQVDSIIKEELIEFAKAEHSPTERFQNIYYAFYLGETPDNIPFPEWEASSSASPLEKGLPAAMEFVKKSKPVSSIWVFFSDGKFETLDYAEGFGW